MTVYVVILETESVTEVCGVYTTPEAAEEYVRPNYHREYEAYKRAGHVLAEGENVDPPSEFGATIYMGTNDFWIWGVHQCEVVT